MKIIYKTPMGAYMVASTQSSLFDGITIYHVCKYDERLAELKKHGRMETEYYIIGSYEKLKTCFDWLREKNLISKDEYNKLIDENKNES